LVIKSQTTDGKTHLKMFESARLKLTAWYLLIIMALSFLFSFVIYRTADLELRRIGRRQVLFRQRVNPEIFRFPNNIEVFTIDVSELRRRIILVLVLINSGILVFAGLSGYFLAGRTLAPIKEMVDEQNRFISDASHELRTPLTSLKSAMEVHLRDKKLNIKDARKLISDNIEDVNKLEKLTDALLTLSRYQARIQKYNFQMLELTDVMAEAIRKIKPLSTKKKIEIKNNTGNLSVYGLKNELVELFVILLDNAIKYSTTGKTIVIDAKKTDGKILVKVKDQGIGISKKDLDLIFDRFYRSVEGRSKEKIKGYGLGLSIAKKIVSLHSGTISVESKAGLGSVFTVLLPVKHTKLNIS